MKIKNFKINQKAASKLAACVLVGTLAATTLTGCGATVNNKTNLLKGTALDGTTVITFADGSKDIAVAVENCTQSQDYKHYRSIISGIYYAPKNCNFDYQLNDVLHHFEIVNAENIVNYLTEDELDKAIKGGLDTDDIAVIITRAIELDTETKINTR